jgi:hypothetical protein
MLFKSLMATIKQKLIIYTYKQKARNQSLLPYTTHYSATKKNSKRGRKS